MQPDSPSEKGTNVKHLKRETKDMHCMTGWTQLRARQCALSIEMYGFWVLRFAMDYVL